MLYMTTEEASTRATIAELKRAGRRLTRARASADAALDAARTVGVRAMSEGHPEAAVARLLGVDRMTVRRWAGK